MSWFHDWFNSPYYAKLYQNRNEQEARSFVDTLVKELRLPKGSRFLDIACGKGRHSIHLFEKGYKVLGIDIAENNIEEASKHTEDNLKFLVYDMRQPLPIPQLAIFDAAVNLFTSFGYFEDDNDNDRTFDAASAALKPGGFMVVDFLNAQKVIKNLVKEEIKSVNGTFFFIHREYDGKHITKTISFDDKGEQHEYRERVQALHLADFEKLFNDNGMQLIKKFGDYRLRAFDPEESDRLVMIAQKL
jgi:SAM-dependent methyltransferase